MLMKRDPEDPPNYLILLTFDVFFVKISNDFAD